MDDATQTPANASTGSALFNTFLSLCWKANIFFTSVALVSIGLLYIKQDSLLYFPTIQGLPRRPSQNPRRYRSPSEYNVPYETHLIPCRDDVTLHSWLLYHPNNYGGQNDRVPTILFFHGNAGNIGLRLPNAHQMHQHLNANIWLIEYRGYGDSDGKPSERGLKLDAEAVWDYILSKKLEHVDPRKVFVFGRSLGGAVAFHLAKYAERRHFEYDENDRGGSLMQHRPPLPAGILVENTFTNIADMVYHLLPLVAPLKVIVLRISWDSLSIVPKLTIPTLFLAGAKDTLVPHQQMLRLHRERRQAKVDSLVRMHIVKDGTHNETWLQGGKEYWMAIQSFLKEVLYAPSTASSSFASSVSSASNNNHSSNSSNKPTQRKVAGSSLPEMKESSLSTVTTSCPERKTEVVMGGEDAAGMISSVGNFMGMAREALSGSTMNVGAAPTSSGGETYKKRE